MAHAVLAEHLGNFTLEATIQDGEPVLYLAHGKVDLLGEEVMARTRGAGGPAWTERLAVRFEWLAAAQRPILIPRSLQMDSNVAA